MTFVRGQLGRAGLLTARDLVIPAPRLAEVTLQEIESLPPKIRARLNAKGVHPDRRLWTYAVELRHWQGRRQIPPPGRA